MTNTSNVHRLPVKPKTETHQYRKHTIRLSFQPKSKTWKWEFTHTPRVHFTGEAKSLQRALRDAKKEVDHVVDGYPTDDGAA